MRHDKTLGANHQHLADCCRIGDLGNLEPEPLNRPGLVWDNPGGVGGTGFALPLIQGPTGRHCQKTRLCWRRELPYPGPCHRLCVSSKLDFSHACTRNFLHRPIGPSLACYRVNLSAGSVSTFQGSEIVVRFTRGPATGTNTIRIPSR